jgi:hypothetical protein
MRARSPITACGLLLVALLGACNLPSATPAAGDAKDIVTTWAAATLTAAGASAPLPSATSVPAASDTPPATATEIIPTATPQNPLVLETTLCWEGPGAQYEVVSALKKDERVELIGQGSLSGWWIVDNPIYHDPCWVQAKDLLIEPGYDLSGLETYYAPPTPTFTPTSTPTSTPTP